MNKAVNPNLIPQVTKTSVHKKVDVRNKLPQEGGNSEFKGILEQQVAQDAKPLHSGIELSTHAAKRIEERKIDFNGEEFAKVKDAMAKVKAKGGKDSLVITDKAAYIVDVANSKVVTAVDKENMAENVFTKIDSTVFVN